MLVKVIKDSIIYHGNIYKTGTSFEIDDAIAKELIQNGNVVAKGNETAEEVAEQTTVEGTISKEQLESMKYQELKKLASDLGINASGTKEELIDRIANEPVEAEPEAIIEDDEEESEELPNTSMPE